MALLIASVSAQVCLGVMFTLVGTASSSIEGNQMMRGNLRSDGMGPAPRSFISMPSFEHRLRVCNAFTDTAPLEVMHHETGSRHGSAAVNLTKDGLLAYKQCRDFPLKLNRFDSVEFSQRSKHLGSFTVSKTPNRDALLLLVVHRRSGSSRADFASHIFSSSPHAQVVVLDMYQGSSMRHLTIREARDSAKGAQDAEGVKASSLQTETVGYNTVVQINSGDYECLLAGNKAASAMPLATVDGENYVALRVGTEGSKAFPEEVVAFPQSGAWRSCVPAVLLVLVLLCV